MQWLTFYGTLNCGDWIQSLMHCWICVCVVTQHIRNQTHKHTYRHTKQVSNILFAIWVMIVFVFTYTRIHYKQKVSMYCFFLFLLRLRLRFQFIQMKYRIVCYEKRSKNATLWLWLKTYISNCVDLKNECECVSYNKMKPSLNHQIFE